MANTFDLTALLQKLFDWGAAHVWTANTLTEIILMAVIFAAAAFLSKPLHARATAWIDDSKLPLRTKRIAKNSRRLILPAVFLAFMLIAANIAAAGWPQIDISITETVIKVLMAWIAIQLLLQFVENPVIRNVFFWAIWLTAALSIFGVLEQTITTLDSMVFSLGTFRVSLLEIIKSILLLIALLYVSLFVSAFFERKVLKSKGLTRSSQVLLVKILRIALVTTAIIIGITSAGIDLSVFAVFSGAIGLGIGLGLQRSISNLFSGLLLLIDQSINPGDVIELEKDGTFGVVNKMAARYTEIVTPNNKSYLIPNEDFITQKVVNWSHGNSLVRLEVPFGVHYDSDPRKVIEIACKVAKKLGRVVGEPGPECYLQQFSDSSLNFSLLFWVSDVEHGIINVKGEILLGLWDAFKEHDIQIPYPHREIRITNVTP